MRVFFLHIPKTAGSTFHDILKNVYPKGRHYFIRNVKYSKVYRYLPWFLRNHYKVIRGHFLFGLQDIDPDQSICLTMLRDPIERTISGFEYIRNNPLHPFHHTLKQKNLSLYEFLKGGYLNNFDNIQVRFLSGDNSIPFGTVDQKTLDTAIKNLFRKDVLFGITERFDESMNYFSKKLNWPEISYTSKNVNDSKKLAFDILDDKTKEIIFETNKFDLQLYKIAVEEFNRRLKDLE